MKGARDMTEIGGIGLAVELQILLIVLIIVYAFHRLLKAIEGMGAQGSKPKEKD